MGVTDYFEAHDLDHLGPFFGRPSDFTGPVIGVQSSAHGEILPFAAEGVVFFPLLVLTGTHHYRKYVVFFQHAKANERIAFSVEGVPF